MSTVITVWGWFTMGRLTQYKVKVNVETFTSFMETLDYVHKADVQVIYGRKDTQRIIVIQQLSNWTGWDNVRYAMEIAKANGIVSKGLRRLNELTKPVEVKPIVWGEWLTPADDDLPF